MAVFSVKGLENFKHTVKAANARLEHRVTAAYRDTVKNVLKELAKHTPQMTGDLAASWQVVVGAGQQPEGATYTHLKAGPRDKVRGHPNAVKEAVLNNEFAIASMRWNSIVKIVNNSLTLSVGNPPGKPLTSEIQLRQENRPQLPGDFMAIKYVAAKYRVLKLDISRV